MAPARGGPGFFSSLWRLLRGRPHVPEDLADNQLLQTILRRRSTRRFRDEEIPDRQVAAILEAGRLAPSTVNLQTWTFAAFRPELWQERFGRKVPFGGQWAVIILADTHRVRRALGTFADTPLVEHTVAVMNASLAAMNMNLAAEALGIGSVMLSETGRSGLLDTAYLREALALPDHVMPLMTIVFGYPRGPQRPMPPKLPLETICMQGAYREADEEVLQDWLAQMKAGYKASHFLSSFEAQLRLYERKMHKAEADLREMILGQ